MRARAVLLLSLTFAPRLGAQTDASIGAGAGPIRYSGAGTIVTVGLTTQLGHVTPSWAVSGWGAVGPVPDTSWAAQGGINGWVEWRKGKTLRPALVADVTGSAQTDGLGTGALRILAEITQYRLGMALGAGGAAGRIGADPAAGGPWLRARAWRRWQGAVFTLAVEPQAIDDAWFTDITVGASRGFGIVEAAANLSGRISGAYESEVGANASATIVLSPRWTLEGAAGVYLPDLYQGFPSSVYASFGGRYHFVPRVPRSVPRRPVVARRVGDSVEVRVKLAGAGAVAVAGEWTGWSPVALVAAGNDVWTVRFALAPGTYRFNLVLDGVRWAVPAGFATVADEFGGATAILVVP